MYRVAMAAMLAATIGCGGSKAVVDKTVELAYCKEPTQQNMENLAKSYSSLINKSRKEGVKESGIYSDYAVALAKMGRREEANSWFNKEMQEFPSSRGYVMKLKKELIPEYLDNNSTAASKVEATEDGDDDAKSDKKQKTKEKK